MLRLGNIEKAFTGVQALRGVSIEVRANEVVVNTTGADFVFDSAYALPSLPAVQAYIRQYHHLPGVEAASQMQAEGLRVGENQTALLQKLEELTLYVIEADRRIREMQAEIDRLKGSK